jgi:YVTN family beta-propeller protein
MKITQFLPILLVALSAPLARAAEAPLVMEPAIVVQDSKGGFDFLEVDEANHRLLANHTGNNTLDVFDAGTGKLIKHIATGKAQGVAIDPVGGKYYVAVSREKKVVIIDSKKLEKTGEVALSGPGDAIVFNPKNGCVYVGHDDGTDLWVIDTKTEKITATITIAEGPEYVLYDAESDRVFQNIKSNDTLLAIDPVSNTIKATWPTAPARHPHGLAYNPKTHHVFCAGANGKLAVMDSKTGKVLSTADIVSSVDQIAFDPGKNRLYCASSSGQVSVLEETADGMKNLGTVKTAPGAKTITFDPKTHAVWIAYADKEAAYVRKLVPQ